MSGKKIAVLLIVAMVIATLLAVTIPGAAFAATGSGGGTAPTSAPSAPSSPSSPSTPAATSNVSSGSSSSSSGTSTSTSTGGKTGAEVIWLAAAGAVLIGSGFVVTKKARA